MTAASHRIPLLICCETYKFTERLLLDSIVHNELGDPNLLYSSNNVKYPITQPRLSNFQTASNINASILNGDGSNFAYYQSNQQQSLLNHGTNSLIARDKEKPITVLNLLYDVTPAEFVTGIVTELGIIPTTSVPPVLRKFKEDD